jgi:hypothetical protein
MKVAFGKLLLDESPETFVRTVEGFVPPGLRARRPLQGS